MLVQPQRGPTAAPSSGDSEHKAPEAGASDSDLGAPLPLHLKKMDGKTLSVVVRQNETFLAIKRRLEGELGLVADRVRFICRGSNIADDKTPLTLDIPKETLIHVVQSKPLLTEIITKERLKANCRFCETAGSQFVYRPICGTCYSEAVVVNEGKIEYGVAKWSDLDNVKVGCAVCDGDDFLTAKRDAGAGFLCTYVQGDFVCPARKQEEDGFRRLQYQYTKGAGEPLLEVLNKLFGYASGGGQADRLHGAPASAASAAGAGAGAGAGGTA